MAWYLDKHSDDFTFTITSESCDRWQWM